MHVHVIGPDVGKQAQIRAHHHRALYAICFIGANRNFVDLDTVVRTQGDERAQDRHLGVGTVAHAVRLRLKIEQMVQLYFSAALAFRAGN